MRTEILSSYHWCWKWIHRKKLLWNKKHTGGYARGEFYTKKNIWFLAKCLDFTHQQKVDRVVENIDAVFTVPSFVKVEIIVTKKV